MTQYLTKSGLEELQKELKHLQEVELPEILDAINKAMAEGDLKENAPLEAAKNERDNINTRISEIEEILSSYELIEESAAGSKGKKVSIGSQVTVQYNHNNSTFELHIVGSSEADALSHKISNESPLAVAILGKKEKDTAQFKVKNKPFEVTILSIT